MCYKTKPNQTKQLFGLKYSYLIIWFQEIISFLL